MINPVITTPCGEIEGLINNNHYEFKGIRYATAKRWEYPEEVTSWDGIYDAKEYGACCYQRRAFEDDAKCNAFYHREFRRGIDFTYSEDCLFLNIFTPLSGSKLPVAIYVHGGTFTGGSSNEAHINGSAFAENGIIYVSFNYRLGPYGFCSHPDLKDENGLCGNYGLYDQQTAIHWVIHNIEAFGGDPDNITIMGQSAGSMSVDIQLSNEANKDCFKGAFMMSSTAMQRIFNRPMTPEGTKPYWEKVMKKAGVSSMEELRKLDPKSLYYAWLKVYDATKQRMRYTFPVFDGKLLKKENFSVKDMPDISYLLGMTSLDMIPPVLRFTNKTWAKTALNQNKNKCYTYMFDHNLPGDKRGNWHCSDMPYVFRTLHTGWRPYTDVDYKISDEMFNSACAFIKNHNPNCPQVPEWTNDYKKTMTFGPKTEFKKYITVKLLLHAGRKGPNR